MAAPVEARCALHHGPVSACPSPVDPELGDLLPDLIQRGVDIRIVPNSRVERCEDCVTDRREQVNEAVAVVAHVAPSAAVPAGYVYRTPLCVEHLEANVIWELRRGCKTWIEVGV